MTSGKRSLAEFLISCISFVILNVTEGGVKDLLYLFYELARSAAQPSTTNF
jgi:hypothetical protein